MFGEHADEFLKFCDKDSDKSLTKDEFVGGILADCEGMSQEDFDVNWAQRMEGVVKAAEDQAGGSPNGSQSALPVAVFNVRRVFADDAEKLASYNEAHNKVADMMISQVPGTLAVFQSTDQSDPHLVHDVQIWSSIEGFEAHTNPEKAPEGWMETMMAWLGQYDSSQPFKGHVFGDANDYVKKMTVEIGKADFQMVPRSVGFIKQDAEGIEGPPVIVYNHRKALDGKMDALLEAHQAYADLVYPVKGVIAITAGIDAEDPLMLHDLQIFANMDVFIGHADMNDPKTKELFMAWINPEKYDMAGYPFKGNVWAAAEHLPMIKEMTTQLGGAQFDLYPIEEIQGKYNFNNK